MKDLRVSVATVRHPLTGDVIDDVTRVVSRVGTHAHSDSARHNRKVPIWMLKFSKHYLKVSVRLDETKFEKEGINFLL